MSANDGARVVLAQSVHANEHDHLLLLDRETGALRQLTPTQNSHYVFGGRFIDGERALLFAADFDYATGQPFQGVGLWRMELESGAMTCLARARQPVRDRAEALAGRKPHPVGAA